MTHCQNRGISACPPISKHPVSRFYDCTSGTLPTAPPAAERLVQKHKVVGSIPYSTMLTQETLAWEPGVGWPHWEGHHGAAQGRPTKLTEKRQFQGQVKGGYAYGGVGKVTSSGRLRKVGCWQRQILSWGLVQQKRGTKPGRKLAKGSKQGELENECG